MYSCIQQRHRRKRTAQKTQEVTDEANRQQNRQQSHPDQGEERRILKCHPRILRPLFRPGNWKRRPPYLEPPPRRFDPLLYSSVCPRRIECNEQK